MSPVVTEMFIISKVDVKLNDRYVVEPPMCIPSMSAVFLAIYVLYANAAYMDNYRSTSNCPSPDKLYLIASYQAQQSCSSFGPLANRR